MKREEINNERAEKLIILANEIWNQPRVHFGTLLPSQLERIGAVYLIGHKSGNRIFYVGKTTNLQQRMYYNHLMGNGSTARLKNYLIKDKDLPKVKNYEDAKEYIQKNCFFKWIRIDDSKERGLIEAGLAWIFEVKYIEQDEFRKRITLQKLTKKIKK